MDVADIASLATLATLASHAVHAATGEIEVELLLESGLEMAVGENRRLEQHSAACFAAAAAAVSRSGLGQLALEEDSVISKGVVRVEIGGWASGDSIREPNPQPEPL